MPRRPAPAHLPVAVAGGNPVSCRAIVQLLRGVGHDARYLATRAPLASLEDRRVLVLGPGLGPGPRESLLASARKAGVAVLELTSGGLEEPEVEVRSVPWPCPVAKLREEIAALAESRPKV